MKQPRLDKTDLLALSLVPGIGHKSIFAIVSSGQGVRDLQDLDTNQFMHLIKGSKKSEAVEAVKTRFQDFRAESEHRLLSYQENGIALITFWDGEYPRLYRTLKNAPIFLFARGNVSLLNHEKSIAVVGTRECSSEGARIATNTAAFFASKAFNIVSGLALGIDTAAHSGALASSGFTTAILVDIANIFPPENKALSEQIVEQRGLLVSENPPGSFVHKGLFVQRDRLQSGLSRATFAIETDVEGGTMHTVGFTLEQSRLLYCPDLDNVEGYPKAYPKSNGIRRLIQEKKAKPYTRSDYPQILSDIENAIRHSPVPGEQQDIFGSANE